MNHPATFSLRTDVPVVPAGSLATRYVLLTLTAPEAPRTAARPSMHVAFVLDRSGSMGGSKIRLAREAVKRALGMLRSDDRFALVAYDDRDRRQGLAGETPDTISRFCYTPVAAGPA